MKSLIWPSVSRPSTTRRRISSLMPCAAGASESATAIPWQVGQRRSEPMRRMRASSVTGPSRWEPIASAPTSTTAITPHTTRRLIPAPRPARAVSVASPRRGARPRDGGGVGNGWPSATGRRRRSRGQAASSVPKAMTAPPSHSQAIRGWMLTPITAVASADVEVGRGHQGEVDVVEGPAAHRRRPDGLGGERELVERWRVDLAPVDPHPGPEGGLVGLLDDLAAQVGDGVAGQAWPSLPAPAGTGGCARTTSWRRSPRR